MRYIQGTRLFACRSLHLRGITSRSCAYPETTSGNVWQQAAGHNKVPSYSAPFSIPGVSPEACNKLIIYYIKPDSQAAFEWLNEQRGILPPTTLKKKIQVAQLQVYANLARVYVDITTRRIVAFRPRRGQKFKLQPSVAEPCIW